MKTKQLDASSREVGSAASRRLRRGGRLPVNLYGHGGEACALSLDAKAFEDALREHARVFSLEFDGQEEPAVVHDVQHDPISQEVVHVDFLRVSLTEKVEVAVSIRIKGPSAGELAGGVLQEVHGQVKLRCLPLSIPEDVEVDVTALQVGDSFHVSELQLPEGVEAVDEPGLVLLSITEPRYSAPTTEEETPEGEEGEGATPESAPESGGE